jgi:hypothetical protein
MEKKGKKREEENEKEKRKKGKIPLHTPALPPRLGGLLAPARSFERFE